MLEGLIVALCCTLVVILIAGVGMQYGSITTAAQYALDRERWAIYCVVYKDKALLLPAEGLSGAVVQQLHYDAEVRYCPTPNDVALAMREFTGRKVEVRL